MVASRAATMCLLIALHRTHPEAALIIAANRDELLARPATPMTVLQESGPRILGGRDLVAGGTWLAVNEHGVAAALTNRAAAVGRQGLRSRGEWPIFLAGHSSAAKAARAFCATFSPADFSPGWVLVGDGTALFYIAMDREREPVPVELGAGMHVLENRPLHVLSPKAMAVRRRLQGIQDLDGAELETTLMTLLAGHEAPRAARTLRSTRPPEAQCPCVHLGPYGTRSSALVRIDEGRSPRISFSEGPPCTHDFRDATGLWRPTDGAGPDGDRTSSVSRDAAETR